ncbi:MULTISPECIES: DUF2993 domain-containing protein [Trichocoleus]|uniref:DUF2993 domain-containing protein n=1 Tax=Trichocoleus desertorum GB2-A4 TaxID=2933944 RepID=A0ABV0JCD2_9CYAN|nr:DUF2993 domain-containing protein [Trichocoleus sp. FACHB-46]MBD1864097.1 DUF2993 domain-containing protein [Trichocoleus sp. FACHB-46]
MSEEPRLEEQVLAQVVEAGLASQLDAADAIAVDVRTDLGKIVQGQAKQVSVTGQGLVVQPDVRVQELEVHTQGVAINPLSALFGKLKLDHPVDTTVRVVLTEVDLNQTLNSDALKQYLSPWDLNVDGQMVTVELQPPMEIQLLSGGKIQFMANVVRNENGQEQRTRFSAVIYPRTEERPVLLEEFRCHPGQGLPFGLTFAFFKKMKELMELPYLKWEDMVVRVHQLEIQEGSLVLQLEAHVGQIPSFGNDVV